MRQSKLSTQILPDEFLEPPGILFFARLANVIMLNRPMTVPEFAAN